ncbi:MAG: alpha/beta fold hydrolase [Desulfovibrionaceae bacterium]|jgi:pimeloyl-ACP methyl ester carboxylesterase
MFRVENCRSYGEAPFAVAVVHGGPGGAGDVAPVARELSPLRGVLEPLQTAETLEGQIGELRDTLTAQSTPPVILIGHSWGAWLSLLVAARHPGLVAKLILIGCGPLRGADAATIMETRLARLDRHQRARLDRLTVALHTGAAKDRDALLAAYGTLMALTDTFSPLPEANPDALPCQERIFQGVWPQANALRRSGRLLAQAATVRCPVVAIHGDYDPHPAQGVREPLGAALADFRFIELTRCGHTPWREKHAKALFYRILREEIREASPSAG